MDINRMATTQTIAMILPVTNVLIAPFFFIVWHFAPGDRGGKVFDGYATGRGVVFGLEIYKKITD